MGEKEERKGTQKNSAKRDKDHKGLFEEEWGEIIGFKWSARPNLRVSGRPPTAEYACSQKLVPRNPLKAGIEIQFGGRPDNTFSSWLFGAFPDGRIRDKRIRKLFFDQRSEGFSL